MKDKDLYYTAGLMDGEGTVTLTRFNKNSNRAPTVSITSTTPELLSYLKDTFGGNIITQKIYKEHHKPSFIWRLRHDAALNFLSAITPHLKEPDKKRRGELILQDYKRLTPRNGKYTTEMLKEKQQFEDNFFCK